MVPVEKYPKYNFVGRILGPRGMTVKQLEKETGCRIFVRGRASTTASNPESKPNKSTPSFSKPSLSIISRNALTEEPLHVYIECQDTQSAAQAKMAHAVEVIQRLLSPPKDGKDELKRQQLVDISLINGTYRVTSTSNEHVGQFRRPRYSADPTSNSTDLQLRPLDAHGAYGDVGSVYGIAQQKRIWQKPRGPDATSEEFAHSVSSREFVTDIVHKTKNSPRRANDAIFSLTDEIVNDSLKAAQTLLASHELLTFGLQDQQKMMKVTQYGAGDTSSRKNLPYPPPLMSTPMPPPGYSMCYMMPPYYPPRY